MALRAGPVGLEYEAGLELTGAGRGLRVELGPSLGPSRGLPQLCSWGWVGGGAVKVAPDRASGRTVSLKPPRRPLPYGLRPALNSQLRTGTDQGNPTV